MTTFTPLPLPPRLSVVVFASLPNKDTLTAVANRDEDGRERFSSLSSPSNKYNGQHPLSIQNEGPDIGKSGSIIKLSNRSSDYFIMTTSRSIVMTRLDPIISPVVSISMFTESMAHPTLLPTVSLILRCKL
nr:hypothetical protein L204_06461 [Cryptococcus depauperatus CBS 7855]